MRYFSMFSGIKGFEKGIEQAYENYAHQQVGQSIGEGFGGRASVGRIAQLPGCIGFSEIDKSAIAVARYRYPEHRNYGDATKLICDELPDFDALFAGFPCQTFSVAGKRAGFQDIRGTMFFEIVRVLRAKRPGHFQLENVAGLYSHDNGRTFRTIINTLVEIGYCVEWDCLNSKHFGVPQNRERVFIVGHLAERECAGKVFSLGDGDETAFPQETIGIVSGTISTKNQSGQCNFDGSTTLIYSKDGKIKNKNVASTITGGGHSGGNHSDMDLIQVIEHSYNREKLRVYDGLVPTLRAQNNGGGYTAPSVMLPAQGLNDCSRGIEVRKDGIAACLKAGAGSSGTQKPKALIENRIRRLTPIECERLQGFPDDWTRYGIDEKGKTFELSDSARYRLCGNAVTTFVIEAQIARMIEVGCLEAN